MFNLGQVSLNWFFPFSAFYDELFTFWYKFSNKGIPDPFALIIEVIVNNVFLAQFMNVSLTLFDRFYSQQLELLIKAHEETLINCYFNFFLYFFINFGLILLGIFIIMIQSTLNWDLAELFEIVNDLFVSLFFDIRDIFFSFLDGFILNFITPVVCYHFSLIR